MVKIPAISPNLLIFGGIAAFVYFISKEVRGIGQDVFGALPELDEGLRQSLTDISSSLSNTTKAISDVTGTVSDLQTGVSNFVTEQQTNFDQFVIDSQTNIDNTGKGITDFFSNLFNQNQINETQEIFNSQVAEKEQQAIDAGFDDVDTFEKATDPNNDPTKFLPPSDKPFTGKESDRDLFNVGLIDQFGRTIQTPPQTSDEQSEFVIPSESLQTESAIINNDSVIITGSFGTSTVGQQGFIINENPVDTFNEVNALFPELSAGQIADFLNEHSGISPTDALRMNPDIRNVSSPDGLEDVSASASDLDAQESIAACTTCKLFNLNCSLCNPNGVN